MNMERSPRLENGLVPDIMTSQTKERCDGLLASSALFSTIANASELFRWDSETRARALYSVPFQIVRLTEALPALTYAHGISQDRTMQSILKTRKRYRTIMSDFASPRINFKPGDMESIQVGQATGDIGFTVYHTLEGATVSGIFDGVTDPAAPHADVQFANLISARKELFFAAHPTLLQILRSPSLLKEAEAFRKFIGVNLHREMLLEIELHNQTEQMKSESDNQIREKLVAKATGVVMVNTGEEALIARFGDVNAAICMQTPRGIEAWVTPTNRTKYFDHPSAALINTARSGLVPEAEAARLMARYGEGIQEAYTVKYNQLGGLGVIGHPGGDFLPHVEIYPVTLPQNRSTTIVTWSDGFEQLCELCGIHQPWAVALMSHAYVVDHPNTKLSSRHEETKFSPGLLLLRYALARGMMGQIVDYLEGRLKIDDVTVTVQSVGPKIIRGFSPSPEPVSELQRMLTQFSYLDDMAMQNLEQLVKASVR